MWRSRPRKHREIISVLAVSHSVTLSTTTQLDILRPLAQTSEDARQTSALPTSRCMFTLDRAGLANDCDRQALRVRRLVNAKPFQIVLPPSLSTFLCCKRVSTLSTGLALMDEGDALKMVDFTLLEASSPLRVW